MVMTNLVEAITSTFHRAEQLDLLHLSLINLLDMVKDGEVDLVLDQDSKSVKQKRAFIDKLIAGVSSEELAEVLRSQPLDFFREKDLGEFLTALRKEAEKFEIVRLTLALEFKEQDLRDMVAVLSEKLGKPVVLSIKVDRSLFGGAIIQHGSYQSDFSLHTQLDIFRSRWHKAVVAS
jgi:F0F1-type ATP synthase delta subunit